MAGQTSRFGFNFFDSNTPGSLDDDSEKFTGEDRLILDSVLAALETHSHHITTSLSHPGGDPDLHLGVAGTGALAAGETYYYCVSFVNSAGLETIAGPEASIEMPELLPTPDVPMAETGTDVAHGELGPGMYYYGITGLRNDEESPLSSPALVTVLDDENMVTLTLPPLGDATSYQIWRMGDSDGGYTRIGTSSTGTFVDKGTVPAGEYGDPANVPPVINAGVNTYSVTITLTGDDLTEVANSASWRIYRTTESGNYGAQSLVHEVVETEDELDPESPLLTAWIDDGDDQSTGSPKRFSQALNVPPFTIETFSGSLPSATGYPTGYPVLDSTGILNVKFGGIWKTSPGPTGPTGPTGPVGATGVGSTGPAGNTGATGPAGSGSGFYKDAWDSGTTYVAGDWVLHTLAIWSASTGNTNAEPGVSGSWTRLFGVNA